MSMARTNNMSDMSGTGRAKKQWDRFASIIEAENDDVVFWFSGPIAIKAGQQRVHRTCCCSLMHALSTTSSLCHRQNRSSYTMSFSNLRFIKSHQSDQRSSIELFELRAFSISTKKFCSSQSISQHQLEILGLGSIRQC